MIRTAATLLALAALSGCVSPRERCQADATKDLRVVQSLIAETEGNLERGYALEREEKIVTRSRLCEDDDGDVYYCRVPETRESIEPVAIDLKAEAEKLSQLRETEARLSRRAERDLAACAALPDS